jgi:ComF family protein
LLDDLAAAVFPARCPGCGDRGEPVCARCAARLRRAPSLPPPRDLDALVAPFEYAGVVREVIARVKYRDQRAAIAWLARCSARAAFELEPVDLVTWPPTTRERRRERGFDHAALLARRVARDLRLRSARLLVRLDGRAQTGRPAADRRAGPEFGARATCRGRKVLLVDDVATTGATLSAAARVLRAAGAAAVVAVTAARTAPPHRPLPTDWST